MLKDKLIILSLSRGDRRGAQVSILIIYADDIIITGDDLEEIGHLKEQLDKEFEVKDLGKLKYFLGIEVAKSRQGIFISQRKYTLDLLDKTGMLGCAPVDSPIEANHKIDADTSGEKETVGFIFSIGSIGSLFGVLLYQNLLKDYPFRDLLFWVQLLTGFAGMLDLILVLRLNLKLGMPDYLFVVIDECVSQMIWRIKWMPLLVLSSKLCPSGIEGTFFALLMSIDNAGLLSSSWGGGLLLHLLKVTRTEFRNLWTAILIRNILRVFPLALLFLVPKSNQNSNILPPEILMHDEGTGNLKEADVEWLLLSIARNAIHSFWIISASCNWMQGDSARLLNYFQW
ncbi:putative folate-biopterin transporter 2 [Platanthera zijinensis]|uniref:Folate-biopterin transporter 2 n=1 Tax=Platanthera zijinensis TaxID=2320716 RepID=A0AAP0AYS2_9ASPA